jgi:hypothetical protein
MMTETKKIELHNAWAVHGLNPDGTEAEEPLATVGRPQDWGDPRWSYHCYRFEQTIGDTHYIAHVHCWTDLVRQDYEYAQLFAMLIVSPILPGQIAQLCGREFLDEEDFWQSEWGPQPPFYECDDDRDWSGATVRDLGPDEPEE